MKLIDNSRIREHKKVDGRHCVLPIDFTILVSFSMQTSELKEIKSIDPMIQSRGRLLDINIFEAYFQ